MGTNIEYSTKQDALKYVGLTELPSEYKKNSNKIWIKAVAKVKKTNGRCSYCVVVNKGSDVPTVIKDFGVSCCIRQFEHIYPVQYLDSAYMPDLRKQSDCIVYLRARGENEDSIKELLAKEIDGQQKTQEQITADRQTVKNLIIRHAVEDALALENENTRLNTQYPAQPVKEESEEEEEIEVENVYINAEDEEGQG